MTSDYRDKFPDWKNGKKDIFHEKHPQYPVYQLAFRGNTTNMEEYTKGKMDKIRSLVETIHNEKTKLGVKPYTTSDFGFVTTNNAMFQDFKFKDKVEKTRMIKATIQRKKEKLEMKRNNTFKDSVSVGVEID